MTVPARAGRSTNRICWDGFCRQSLPGLAGINLFDAEVRGARILARDNTNKMAIFNEGVLNRLLADFTFEYLKRKVLI